MENEGCPEDYTSKKNFIEEKDDLGYENDTKKEEYIKSDIEKIIASSIYFELNQSSINPAKKSKLKDIKNLLNTYSEIKINIVGYASSDGPSEYNMLLSEKRANMVKMTLINLGVNSSRLKVTFSGENNPTYSNLSNEGKSKNRRVEISVQ